MKRLTFIQHPSNPLCFWLMNLDPNTRKYEVYWMKNGKYPSNPKWRFMSRDDGKLSKQEMKGIICEL